LGAAPEHSTFWSDGVSLQAGIFQDRASIMDMSIMLGALLAAGLSGRFQWRLGSMRACLAATVGGVVMGYGARLSGGGNIGAYFSSIASGDLTGWVWAVGAAGGSLLVLRLIPGAVAFDS
jgi:uncharacterized protein